MAKYNLINNGTIYTLTSSGTGNKDLDSTQLSYLSDGELSSGGIVLGSSDNLYIEADLQYRIKVNEIRLYAEDMSKLSNVNFYYKNSLEEDYIGCTKDSTADYYYATIPGISAPKYVLTTISGFDSNIYELQIYNDDYIVGFGEDGTKSAVYLEQTPVGQESETQTIPIYNNSTSQYPANAYVVIDTTGEEDDTYLKIASNIEGPYYGQIDGIILSDNSPSSEYKWKYGVFDNTTVINNDYLQIADTSTSVTGTYTTPVFDLENKYNASYYNLVEEVVEGTSFISKDPNQSPGTIEVRSSNIAPEPLFVVYWPYFSNNTTYLYRVDLHTGISSSHQVINHYYRRPRPLAIDHRRNLKCQGFLEPSYYNDNDVRIIDENENVKYNQTGSFTGEYRSYINKVEYSYNGDIWAWCGDDELRHIRYDLQSVYYSTSVTSMPSLSVEYDGDGVWYVDEDNNKVVHLAYDHSTQASITSFTNPQALAASVGGTCWLSDTDELKLYKLDTDGTILKTISVEKPIVEMIRDYEGGFYCRTASDIGEIYHYNYDGSRDMYLYKLNIDQIRGCPYGCILYNSSVTEVYYVDRKSESITNTITLPTHEFRNYPDILWIDSESNRKDIDELNRIYIPKETDVVWGVNGGLSWKEVSKIGHFLPKERYQQTRITLQTKDPAKNVKLKSINIPKSVKITGINPQTYQNLYVKTYIPSDANLGDFNTKVKVWWDVQE